MERRAKVWVVLVINLAVLGLGTSWGSQSAGNVISAEAEASKAALIHQISVDWIEVGKEQYNRALFKSAARSFDKAGVYRDYLTAGEQAELSDFLEKMGSAELERKKLLSRVEKADRLLRRGELVRGRAYLETIKDNWFLTGGEKATITSSIGAVEASLEEEKRRLGKVYARSVLLYEAGDLRTARLGFMELARNGLSPAPKGRTAEDYLMKISVVLGVDVAALKQPEEEIREKVKDDVLELVEVQGVGVEVYGETEKKEVDVTEFVVKEDKEETEVGDVRTRLVVSYVKTVMSSAVSEIGVSITQGEFERASEILGRAEKVVTENKDSLGVTLFNQYFIELGRLSGEVALAEESAGNWLLE